MYQYFFVQSASDRVIGLLKRRDLPHLVCLSMNDTPDKQKLRESPFVNREVPRKLCGICLLFICLLITLGKSQRSITIKKVCSIFKQWPCNVLYNSMK